MPLWRKGLTLAFLMLAQASCGVLLGAALFSWTHRAHILPNIYAGDTALGGLTPDEAAARLAARLPGEETRLTVRAGGREWSLTLGELGVRYLPEETAGRAFMAGREGNPLARLAAPLFLLVRPRVLPYAVDAAWPALHRWLEQVAEATRRPARDAAVVYRNGRLEREPEAPGWEMDVEAVAAEIKAMLARGRAAPVDAVGRTLEPSVRLADLEGVRELLAAYTTSFDPTARARSHNIQMAARALDGAVVPPGWEFSLDARIGPRLVENGYREAPVIVEDRVVPGPGGGVCQVATTLYNAVLFAGLEITERHPHSLPVDYVPLGRDATLASPSIDFRFVNNTGAAIMIAASVEDNRLTVMIFGTQPFPSRTVRLEVEREVVAPEVRLVVDPSLPPGAREVRARGREGYRVKVYRLWEEEGRPVRRELVSDDLYKPAAAVVAVGPSPGVGPEK
ncbi:MAG: VanW family protein [Firmicutes bacterium]|nr:VanW family protein [Bacillota bacterium]